jgi:hypothetical protein
MNKAVLFLIGLIAVMTVLVGCKKSTNGSTNLNSEAPYGTVVSISSGSFVIRDTSGVNITIDIVSGTTYQYTTASTVSAANIGGYVAGSGSVSNNQLNAVNLALVPTPPSFVVGSLSEVQQTPTGTVYFGQITSYQNGIITISWDGVSKTINASNATYVTLTVTSNFQAIKKGDNVEVNGPEVSSTEYQGHQINIGLTPAVVGQFD